MQNGTSRTLCWFSCGAASAVATRLVLQDTPDALVLYCDTKSEHPDNVRFLRDCERWFGVPVQRHSSSSYADIWDVFHKTKWLVGVQGARCSTELKKLVRRALERPGDRQVFGFTVEERERAERFVRNNPDINAVFPLIANKYTKQRCLEIVSAAGIALPAMYQLGYRNNNCIGCVKGGAGYWNKIRKDFPDVFSRMAKVERELDVAICKTERGGSRQRVFLDELDPRAGSYRDLEFSCGLWCGEQ